jgi:hypothetical protein
MKEQGHLADDLARAELVERVLAAGGGGHGGLKRPGTDDVQGVPGLSFAKEHVAGEEIDWFGARGQQVPFGRLERIKEG